MSRLPNISLRLHGGISAAECIELARAAETAEFAGIWFAENAFARGTLPAAAACAMATQRIAINAGVFNPFSRHPTMMAMEIGALDELSGGRATLSIGSGIASATEKLGMDPSKPVPGLRDTLTIVRSLLRSGEADHTGAAFSARKVKLDYTPREDSWSPTWFPSRMRDAWLSSCARAGGRRGVLEAAWPFSTCPAQ
jgi:5,10-methylenetetrahydromethanopterin reductase